VSERKRAKWKPAMTDHTPEPCLWFWGDWSISRVNRHYWLSVSSGVEYGPFATWEAVTQHAEDVRGD